MIKKIILFFLSWKILTLFIAFGARFLLPNIATFEGGKFAVNMPFFIRIWSNFDGYHYMEIAQRGYQNLEQGFFPLFPIFIKSLATIFKMPLIISGQFISNLSFIVSLFVIYKLLINDKNKGLFNLLILAIIFFPTSFFYGAVYNDSLFFLLATLTIYFSREKKWLLASLSGGLATLTRLNGLALFFFVVFEYVFSNEKSVLNQWSLNNLFQQIKKCFSFKEIKKNKIYSVVIIPLTFIGYLLYINLIFTSWKTLFSSMKVWDQNKLTLPLVVFWRYFKIIVLYPTFKINYWVAVFELFMVTFYIFLLFYSYKKIRFSYWMLFAFSILIPSLTGTFQGMPRYGLHLFPMYLSICLLLKDKNLFVKLLYFFISLILMIFALTLFTRGYFVA